MSKKEETIKRLRESYQEKFADRDRQRQLDQRRAERVMIAKRFHGEESPDYPDLDRECCMAVLQVYHERPFDIGTKAAIEVNRAASMVECSHAELTFLRDFMGDIIASCTVVLGAPSAPINIQPDVFEVMVRTFNRFIDLCINRRPDLRKKWRKWENFDSNAGMEE